MYYLTALPVVSLKQLLASFLQHWEAPRPCCHMSNFIVVAATTVECAGPQQRTVESPVFVHYVILKLRVVILNGFH